MSQLPKSDIIENNSFPIYFGMYYYVGDDELCHQYKMNGLRTSLEARRCDEKCSYWTEGPTQKETEKNDSIHSDRGKTYSGLEHIGDGSENVSPPHNGRSPIIRC